MTALIVIAILFLLIVTHELGHFIFAKLFRVRVDEFGIGYPPRALTFGRWGGTEYTLNWIPFGGFVRLFGEDENAHGKGSLADAARWKQALILVAGVAANALVAWMLFAAALHIGVPQVINTPQKGEITQLIASDVVPGSPAAVAGILPGDEIRAVQSIDGARPKSLTPEAIVNFVRARGGVQITITYVRQDKENTVTMIPANAVVPGSAGRVALGIGLVMVGVESLPLPDAMVQAWWTTLNAFQYVGMSLWSIVSGFVEGSADLSQVVGPVGLVSVIGDASHNGTGYVLELAAFIAVNLAIINLIPIPALDGGRLLVTIIEGILRRPLPKLAIQALNTSGIALVIFIMLTVTYHDIARLFA